ncbi:hypothetical protein HPB47_017187 [Ixodes persulcatus]|uniref:Uncharacterized protein n=1 Tax=Ixodes persulcatus TaxID=34615 RepID=A0AC60QRI8_IXOPE|nr:hypothetical protein HPB47_017187 [Ixodes persulcatus]
MDDGSRQRVTAAQREELDTFMFENPSLVHGATELSPAQSRDDKVCLWTELTSRLNYLGPPRKEPEGWKRYWAMRVSKAQTRAVELAKQARQTGGGGGRVRSLASSYAHILTLVGEDSALGAPGFSVPAFEDEAEERHDEAAMQAVANQTLQLQQNEARDVEFQGQLPRSIETLSHRMEAVAEANQEQARATQAVALELQNTTRVLVEASRQRFHESLFAGIQRPLLSIFLALVYTLHPAGEAESQSEELNITGEPADPAAEPKFIVTLPRLLKLLTVCFQCFPPATAKISRQSPLLRAVVTYAQGHKLIWEIQPRLRRRSLLTLLLCGAITFSGASPPCVLHLPSLIGIATVQKSRYFKIQSTFVFPAALKRPWEQTTLTLWTSEDVLKTKRKDLLVSPTLGDPAQGLDIPEQAPASETSGEDLPGITEENVLYCFAGNLV